MGEQPRAAEQWLTTDATLDALIRVSHGELQPEDRGAAPTAPVGDVPGALQEWRGTQRDGVAVRVWLAGIVKRDHYLTITAVLVESRAEACGLLYLYFRDGQMTAEVVVEGDTLVGLRIGGSLLRAR